MFTKVLFAAVAEPDPENRWDFLPLRFVETFVESEGFLALAAAGAVVVGVPVAARHADAAAGLFYQCRAGERLACFLVCGHWSAG